MTETTRPAARVARRRTYLMCPPEHFTVEYAINPWMNPDEPVDTALAMRQWQGLHSVFTSLGHAVHTVTPVRGLPDMVFAANGATVIDGSVLGARFRYSQRQAEAEAYLGWLRANHTGTGQIRESGVVNEGEGDIVFAGRAILAGHGFRTDPAVSF